MENNFSHEQILKAVRCACSGFSGNEERWGALHTNGATDEQICQQVQHEFYLGGGCTVRPDGFVNHSAGGAHLEIEYFLFRSDKRIKISGKCLLDLVREAFDIPKPGGQLRLL